jgi:hypothetical protein
MTENSKKKLPARPGDADHFAQCELVLLNPVNYAGCDRAIERGVRKWEIVRGSHKQTQGTVSPGRKTFCDSQEPRAAIHARNVEASFCERPADMTRPATHIQDPRAAMIAVGSGYCNGIYEFPAQVGLGSGG